MNSIREVVGHAVAEGIDYRSAIGALAFTDRLGSMLWRLKYGGDASAFAPALALVVRRMRRGRKEGRALLEKIATRCLVEYMYEKCDTCFGRGNIVPEGAPVATHVCTVCAGTGRKRHADRERALALGVPLDRVAKLEPLFARAHEIISNADAHAGVDVTLQLRNGLPKGA